MIVSARQSLIAAATCIPVALASPAIAQQSFNWKMFTSLGTSDVGTQLHRGFIEDLGKASNGRIKVTLFTAGQLPYKATDTLQALSTRQIDIGHIAVGFMAGDLPELNAGSVPFSCTNLAAFYDKSIPAIRSTFDPVMSKKFKVSPLLHWSMPAQQIFVRDPVNGLNDLKGRKIRAWNREQVETMQLLGGSGVNITSAEVIPALQRGVVDGAFTANITALAWKIYDVAKHSYVINYTLSHELVAINEAALAELPGDLRALVEAKSNEWHNKYRDGVLKADQEARSKLTENGMTLKEADQTALTQLRELTAPIAENWIKANGETGAKLLDLIRRSCS